MRLEIRNTARAIADDAIKHAKVQIQIALRSGDVTDRMLDGYGEMLKQERATSAVLEKARKVAEAAKERFSLCTKAAVVATNLADDAARNFSKAVFSTETAKLHVLTEKVVEEIEGGPLKILAGNMDADLSTPVPDGIPCAPDLLMVASNAAVPPSTEPPQPEGHISEEVAMAVLADDDMEVDETLMEELPFVSAVESLEAPHDEKSESTLIEY